MEIEIKNFGPIDNLKFDLNKDLHLIYGKNAIGKSYATYCIYCLLKNIGKSINYASSSYYAKLYLDNNESLKFEKNIESKVKDQRDNETIDFTNDFFKFIEILLGKMILNELQNSLSNSFFSLRNLKNQYSQKNYTFIISISASEKLEFSSNDEGNLELKYRHHSTKLEIIKKVTKTTSFLLNINSKKEFSSAIERKFILKLINFIRSKINKILNSLNLNISDIYYLPASRSGLYQALNAFTPIIAALTQNRFFMERNKNIELPSLSEPISDYFLDLSTVNKKRTNKEFEEIIEQIQNEILNGEIEYNDKTKKIIYKPKNIDLELNLSEASSMVSELSPLVIYLKHIINNKYNKSTKIYGINPSKKYYDILFIEEPEAHLHPEIQVKLIEIFANLTQLNLKIFITSHSNYMFNKLNNLLITNKINEKKVAVYHLIKGAKGSTINTEMVVTQDGINDENFQDVSVQLYNERLNYLEEQNDKNS
ncbi:AAA family ATPase [bacterium]|nr:AAA family ATPase [bacterium]